jgi:ribosomal protein S27AE
MSRCSECGAWAVVNARASKLGLMAFKGGAINWIEEGAVMASHNSRWKKGRWLTRGPQMAAREGGKASGRAPRAVHSDH